MGRTARGNNWESVRLLVNPSTVSGTTGLRVAAGWDRRPAWLPAAPLM